jgi:small subunit ribosomal protein S2
MARVSMKQLLEAGVHFGHQTRRWNPKMSPFIFTERNGIHIIDLQQTVACFERAYDYVRDLAADGRTLLFVGTKKQAQEAVQEQATRCNMFYVNQRWLGGMLTNFQTIQQRLRHLSVLEAMRDGGELVGLPKREAMAIEHEIAKLTHLLGGVKTMRRLPDALFIVDTKKERLAVAEARRLEIPIVAMVDTNADPDEVTYPIPANDDAIRAVRLICERIADAVIEGRMMRTAITAEEEGVAEEELASLPMSFAPDEEGAAAPLDAELSYAPPAVPEAQETGEPLPAPEHSPAR